MNDITFDPRTYCTNAAPIAWKGAQAAADPVMPNALTALASPIAVSSGLAEPVAFVDPGGTVCAVNSAWSQQAVPGTTYSLVPGDNYLDFLRRKAREGIASATSLIALLSEPTGSDAHTAVHIDLTDRTINGHIYRVLISACSVGTEQWHMIARYDMTEIITLRQRSRRLARCRLRAEEAERRRVARDLHDGTAQDLVALQLALAPLRRNASATVASELAGVDEAVESLQREIRSLLLLYHPPILDERGLACALRTMIAGFGRRADLHVTMLLEYESPRVTVLEATLYRVAQEALANVHRHAGAGQVQVTLIEARGALHLFVCDDGVGFCEPGGGAPHLGVGLTAMDERLRDVGGKLVILTGRSGTSVIASVPIAEE